MHILARFELGPNRIQTSEEFSFWCILIFVTAFAWIFVRWKRKLVFLVAPIVCVTTFYASRTLIAALFEPRDWLRGFPDYPYVALAFSAAEFPILATYLAFVLPKKKGEPAATAQRL